MACTALGNSIITTSPGTVVALEGPQGMAEMPFTLTIDGVDGLFNLLTGIVTSVGVNASSGFQFTHALREFIYVYVFTERIGELVINALVFPDACNFASIDSPGLCNTAPATTGFERAMQWYECNRITSRANSIVINLGADLSYECFLVGFKADIPNADTCIGQVTMRFNFVPNIIDDSSNCFSADISCLVDPCGPQGFGYDFLNGEEEVYDQSF